jgi:superfamily II DNA or RNA helicase
MDRENILERVLNNDSKNILLELPTGYGKTRYAIEKIKQLNSKNILIVIPRNVLKENWNKEIEKWGGLDCKITYSTYVSIPKNIGSYDIIVFDEAHHITERCRESLKYYNFKNAILLSATINRNLKKELYRIFKFETIKVSTREAIDNEVLPEPIVYLIPMELDNTTFSEILVKNPKGKTTIEVSYASRWNYLRNKEYRVELKCTQKQYIQDLNGQIEWYKQKALRTNNIVFKNKWLYLCSERLKYLATIKNSFIKDLLLHLKNYRTLTFCTDIKQTEELGKYCINSKNKSSEEYLDMFNNNKIKHITACNSLNEGVNLNNCRIGIFSNVNASEIMTIQKIGRILRHKQPTVIIPYYKNTREQELVIKMLENFNKENIKIINDLKNLKL